MTQLTDPERDYPASALTDLTDPTRPLLADLAAELPEPDLTGFPDGTTYSRYRVRAYATAGQVELPYPHSINDAVATQEQRRPRNADVTGRVMFFPRTGMIMLPTASRDGGWACMVLHGGTKQTDQGQQMYPRGGYDLYVGDDEMSKAIEVVLTVNGLDTEAAGRVGRARRG